MTRKLDARIALEIMGWQTDGKLIVPPNGDPKISWCAHWDGLGCPNWMPAWSDEIEDAKLVLAHIEKNWEERRRVKFLRYFRDKYEEDEMNPKNLCETLLEFVEENKSK